MRMRAAYVVDIITPKKVRLNGLWFKAPRSKRAVIFVHGLTGSAFSMHRIFDAFLAEGISVLAFNNRGFEQVASVSQRVGNRSMEITVGGTHEVFTDCVDDIEGALHTARALGATDIYLAGHSTGAQKSIYWASKKGNGVKGYILLGPLSDYEGALSEKGKKRLKKDVAHAKRLVAAGKPHMLMPQQPGEWFLCDAQRFLSLYTPDSPEEIFTYIQPGATPCTLQSVRAPILVLLAGADEYGSVPAKKIADWFVRWIQNGHVVIVPKVRHSFKGAEKAVAKTVRKFMKEC